MSNCTCGDVVNGTDVVIAGSIVVDAVNGVEGPCGRVKHPEKEMVLVRVLSKFMAGGLMWGIPMSVIKVTPSDPELAGEGLGWRVGGADFCFEHSGHLPSNFCFPQWMAKAQVLVR
jgi:hypothetical protein